MTSRRTPEVDERHQHVVGVDFGTLSGRALVDRQRADAYDALYAEYLALHDHFGRGGTDVLHRLRSLRVGALVRAARDAPPATGAIGS